MEESNNKNDSSSTTETPAPLIQAKSEKELYDEEILRHTSQTLSFLVFNFMIAPLCLFIICIILGGILAAVEGWSFLNGFYFIANDVTGTGPFFSDPGEISVFGEIMEIIISVIAVTCAGAVVGLSALMSLSSDLPNKLGIIDSPKRGAFAIFIIIPAVVILFSFILGALFAWGEGWAVRSGFEFIIQTVCGLAAPLTGEAPKSDHAKIFALLIAVAALGITSVIVGLVGAMAICETTVAYIEVKLGLAQWEAIKFLKCKRDSMLPNLNNKQNRSVQPMTSLEEGNYNNNNNNGGGANKVMRSWTSESPPTSSSSSPLIDEVEVTKL
jgi:hypothetical protein